MRLISWNVKGSNSVKYEIDEHDKEGRVITLEYNKFYMVNIYT